MRLLSFIIFCINILTFHSQYNDSTSVLFVGNSLTQYNKNKMITILKKFVSESNAHLQVETEVKDGARLDRHTQFYFPTPKIGYHLGHDTIGATTMQRIIKGNYDYVVLQDPEWTIKERRENRLYPRIKYIDSICKSMTNSKILFYETLPHYSKTPVAYCYGCSGFFSGFAPDSIKLSPIKVTYSTVQQELDTISAVGNEIETSIAKGSQVIPTAKIITKLYLSNPNLKMTIVAGHPSKIVQYTLAVIFYTYLTNKNPNDLKWNYKLNKELASEIKKVVYDYYKENNYLQQ